MLIFVTGAAGQLGFDVMRELARRPHTAVASDLAERSAEHENYIPLDITDAGAVERALTELRPDAVIHCAAWTAVDAAEDNQAAVRRINVDGTANLARSCRRVGAKVVYISTDYVFDGGGTEPWRPDCADFAPLNVYGKSKLDGERAVTAELERFFIVRTSWVFGAHGNNFVKTALRAGRTHDSVRMVNDQIGAPTYTPDLAHLLCDMVETDKYGIYHATNEGGHISWYDFTCEIYRQAGLSTEEIPVTTEEYGLSKAKRPLNSRLDTRKLSESGFTPLPPWQDALGRYLRETKEVNIHGSVDQHHCSCL